MPSETKSEFQQLKDRLKATWMAGDFGRVAKYAEAVAEEFVALRGLKPQMRVLDVACGSGHLAIPVAQAGAVVSGVDIAPNLLVQARERAGKLRLPFSVPETVEFYRTYYGPTQKAFAALPEDKQPALRRDMENLFEQYNRATDGATCVEAEYLEVVAGEARRLSDVLIMSILLEFIRSPAGGRPSLLLPPLFNSENAETPETQSRSTGVEAWHHE
jgi:SAM-dependent methyltransferase